MISIDILLFYFYRRDYGFLGPTLHQAVIKARAAPPTPATPTPPSSGGVSSISAPLSTPTPTISRPQTPQISTQPIRQGSSLLTAGVINNNSNSSGSGSDTKIQRQTSLTQTGVVSATNAQKYVIVTPRPSTPSGLQASTGIVKYQTSATQVSRSFFLYQSISRL